MVDRAILFAQEKSRPHPNQSAWLGDCVRHYSIAYGKDKSLDTEGSQPQRNHHLEVLLRHVKNKEGFCVSSFSVRCVLRTKTCNVDSALPPFCLTILISSILTLTGSIMKTTAIVSVALVASAQAFAPASQGRAGSQLNESLFDKISNMDLFAPKADQNTYGARNNKNVSIVLVFQRTRRTVPTATVNGNLDNTLCRPIE